MEVIKRLAQPHMIVFSHSAEPGVFSYAAQVYQVIFKDGDAIDARLDEGEALYLTDHPELALAFDIVERALRPIRAACAKKDAKKK